MITLSGQAVQGSWKLPFRYPGARVASIDGAPWAIRDGVVIVTGTGHGSPGRTAAFTLQASGPPSPRSSARSTAWPARAVTAGGHASSGWPAAGTPCRLGAMPSTPPRVLAIAGSDSGGGAGSRPT